ATSSPKTTTFTAAGGHFTDRLRLGGIANLGHCALPRAHVGACGINKGRGGYNLKIIAEPQRAFVVRARRACDRDRCWRGTTGKAPQSTVRSVHDYDSSSNQVSEEHGCCPDTTNHRPKS